MKPLPCGELAPIMMKHGITMFFPFEVQAGNDVRVYRQQYPDLGIMCGLDKRALAGTLADVDREIARCADMVKLGRYVPGFDHLNRPMPNGIFSTRRQWRSSVFVTRVPEL